MPDVQRSALEVYSYVEEWWGESLTLDLVQRMANSPRRHLKAFISTWPEQSDLLKKSHIPELGPGELRPTFGNPVTTREMTSTGVALLLYTPSIILDFEYLIPFAGDSSKPWTGKGAGWWRMIWLASLKPLVMDGSIYFADRMGFILDRSTRFRDLLMSQPANVWSPYDPFVGEHVRRMSAEHHDRLGDVVPTTMIENLTYACNLSCNLGLAEDGLATPIAINADDRTAYSIAASSMRADDGRLGKLSTLVKVQVPALRHDLSEIVAVRRSSETFSAWRAALSGSLAAVQNLPDDDTAIQEARSILASELEESLRLVLRDARRSPSLASLVEGWRGFTLAGLGAGVPVAAVGDPLQSAVAAATGAAAGGVLDRYFEHRRTSRESKAILDVYGWFLESISPGDDKSPFIRQRLR